MDDCDVTEPVEEAVVKEEMETLENVELGEAPEELDGAEESEEIGDDDEGDDELSLTEELDFDDPLLQLSTLIAQPPDMPTARNARLR